MGYLATKYSKLVVDLSFHEQNYLIVKFHPNNGVDIAKKEAEQGYSNENKLFTAGLQSQ